MEESVSIQRTFIVKINTKRSTEGMLYSRILGKAMFNYPDMQFDHGSAQAILHEIILGI